MNEHDVINYLRDPTFITLEKSICNRIPTFKHCYGKERKRSTKWLKATCDEYEEIFTFEDEVSKIWRYKNGSFLYIEFVHNIRDNQSSTRSSYFVRYRFKPGQDDTLLPGFVDLFQNFVCVLNDKFRVIYEVRKNKRNLIDIQKIDD
jgi:hypothetical protein